MSVSMNTLKGMIKMKNKYFTETEMVETLLDTLKNYDDMDITNLSHNAFNMDYYIIGTYQSKQALDDYGIFNAIEKVQTYQQELFGEVFTDLSNPESVASFLWFILGSEFLHGDSDVALFYEKVENHEKSISDFITFLNERND